MKIVRSIILPLANKRTQTIRGKVQCLPHWHGDSAIELLSNLHVSSFLPVKGKQRISMCMIATTSFLQNWFHKPDCQIPAEKFILDHTQINSESIKLQQEDNLHHAFNCINQLVQQKTQKTRCINSASSAQRFVWIIWVHTLSYNTSFPQQRKLQASFLTYF